MSVSFSDLTQKGVGSFAKLTTPSARSRSIKHLTIPRSISRQQGWSTGMKNESTHTTHVCGKHTHACVSKGIVWAYLKSRFPEHTEKRAARALNVSHRTVERWRTKIPSGRHIILMIITFPDFVRHLTAPAEQRRADYDALARRHEKLQAQGNEEHGTRESRCDKDGASSGD